MKKVVPRESSLRPFNRIKRTLFIVQPFNTVGGLKMDNQELTMPTKYDPSAVEKDRYDYWVNGKFFEAKNDPEKNRTPLSFPAECDG